MRAFRNAMIAILALVLAACGGAAPDTTALASAETDTTAGTDTTAAVQTTAAITTIAAETTATSTDDTTDDTTDDDSDDCADGVTDDTGDDDLDDSDDDSDDSDDDSDDSGDDDSDDSDDDSDDSDDDSDDTAGAFEIRTAESELGTILVDGECMSLYAFLNDADGEPTCAGDCADQWPALTAMASAGEGVDDSLLGTVDALDGAAQVTYGGWPLYYFAGDEAPGDINGQGLGDVWYVIGPDGEPVEG